ncbi:MAG TPA: DUF6134 family protein [Planctomycetaceae bacterium]|nr:DUF6134 family protein [Planctomycetaceae bacterium]
MFETRRSRCERAFRPFVAVAVAMSLFSGTALADSGAPQPVERQTRTYSISIDGTRRGSSKAEFRSGNGIVWIQSESEIRINYLVYKYNYTSSGTEIWKNGRVAAFENTADYNGTSYTVKGTSTPRGLQIATNGTTSLVSRDVWDTSYLLLPDRLARVDAAAVVLLDSDKGRLLSGKIQLIGEETLAEGQKPCTHYRISGDAEVDVWFDASRRLVRQVSHERGHKVRFELLSVE